MNPPTCADCAFFNHDSCRRYPPTVIAEVHTQHANENRGQSEEVYSITSSQWPEVGPTDWCGEHQRAPEGKP